MDGRHLRSLITVTRLEIEQLALKFADDEAREAALTEVMIDRLAEKFYRLAGRAQGRTVANIRGLIVTVLETGWAELAMRPSDHGVDVILVSDQATPKTH